MSCGVPCVTTDCGDSRHIVAETGRVVPPRNPQGLAEACLAVLHLRPGDRAQLGEAARARIAHDFDLRSTAERHYALWEAAAEANLRPPLRTAPSSRAAARAA